MNDDLSSPVQAAAVQQSDGAFEPADIVANLAEIRGAIRTVEQDVGRPEGACQLVAVSKFHSAEKVAAALEAGQKIFGENRVQEAQGKFPQLREDHPDLKLHLIGPLQTNKADQAVKLFDVIESLDRPKLARALAKEAKKLGRCPECYIQVNTGEEEQKAGVLPQEADDFVNLCRDDLKLPVVGLMCIPPVDEEPALHFALLRKIAERNGLSLLSMGMSGDYETAVAYGATSVRVGSAIFGTRPANT